MSKELPYFRFTAFEWLNDDISLEDYPIKGLFADICAYYWFKDCSLTIARLELRFPNATKELQHLLEIGIIKRKENSDFIEISFLNEQYDQLSERRKRLQAGGSKGGTQRTINYQARLKLGLKPDSSYNDNDNDKDKEHSVGGESLSEEGQKVGGTEKQSKEERNKIYLPLAKQLSEIVQSVKHIKITNRQLASWSNSIRILSEKNEIIYERIKRRLDWYAIHISDPYIPEIQSGEALRKKFINLENAILKEKNKINNKQRTSAITSEQIINLVKNGKTDR